MEIQTITEKNLPLLIERVEHLRHFTYGENYHSDNNKQQIVATDELKVGDDKILVSFPNTGNNYYSIADFMRYTDHLENIQVVNDFILAGTTVQIPVNYPVSGPIDIAFKSANYTLRMVFAPFLVNLIDAQSGNFTQREYYALEIYNPYGVADYMLPEVHKMVNRVLFYLSKRAQKNFHIHTLPHDATAAWTNEPHEEEPILMEHLPVSSPLLRMYRHALSRSNNCMTRYVSFYKMIEGVAPLALKEKMYHELFAHLKNHSGQYNISNLNNIIASVNNYNNTIKESILASTVLKNCVLNIKEFYALLPQSIRKKCAKDLNMDIAEDLSQIYSTGLNTVYDKVGQVLYATRRSIAHVPSMYNLTGDECAEKDLAELNLFMERVCYSLIEWNNRQPDHIRLKD